MEKNYYIKLKDEKISEISKLKILLEETEKKILAIDLNHSSDEILTYLSGWNDIAGAMKEIREIRKCIEKLPKNEKIEPIGERIIYILYRLLRYSQISTCEFTQIEETCKKNKILNEIFEKNEIYPYFKIRHECSKEELDKYFGRISEDIDKGDFNNKYKENLFLFEMTGRYFNDKDKASWLETILDYSKTLKTIIKNQISLPPNIVKFFEKNPEPLENVNIRMNNDKLNIIKEPNIVQKIFKIPVNNSYELTKKIEKKIKYTDKLEDIMNNIDQLTDDITKKIKDAKKKEKMLDEIFVYSIQFEMYEYSNKVMKEMEELKKYIIEIGKMLRDFNIFEEKQNDKIEEKIKLLENDEEKIKQLKSQIDEQVNKLINIFYDLSFYVKSYEKPLADLENKLKENKLDEINQKIEKHELYPFYKVFCIGNISNEDLSKCFKKIDKIIGKISPDPDTNGSDEEIALPPIFHDLIYKLTKSQKIMELIIERKIPLYSHTINFFSNNINARQNLTNFRIKIEDFTAVKRDKNIFENTESFTNLPYLNYSKEIDNLDKEKSCLLM